MNDKQIFLEAALKIANRIVESAIWDNDKCTWKIYAPSMTNLKDRTGKWENAGGTVYQGTAGIALFLAEIFRITKDRKFERTLMGAVNNSLSESEKLPLYSFGFHSGLVGIAYTLVLSGKYLDNENLFKKGLNIITPMLGKESEGYGIDVISGAGGAIQPLLKIYEMTDDQNILNVAMNLGESLISKANMEPHGWSWGGGNHNYRNLCGYAHGASGIGHAFLELYNLTGSNYYLYAADQAFLYERQFYSEGSKNWPDFRYSDLYEYVRYNKIEELKEALKKNNLAPYSIKYMSAWCHGAPGIGLSRLRAYELTNNELYKKESIKACENTITSLEKIGNYSLCHGLFGNAETLILGNCILKEENYLKIVIEKAIEGIEKFENKNSPWICGTVNSISDPSLMLGETGIGYFYLRLFSKDTPSVLLLFCKNKYIPTVYPDKLFEIKRKYVAEFFGETIELLKENNNDPNAVSFELPLRIGEISSDITIIYEKLKEFLNNHLTINNVQISRQFYLDSKRYLKTIGILDFTKEFIQNLTKKNVNEIVWEKERIIINENSELYSYINEETFTLLRRANNKIISKKIDELPVAILKTLVVPKKLNEIVYEIIEQFEDATPVQQIEKVVKLQLVYLYQAHLIDIIPDLSIEMQIVDKMERELSCENETMSNCEIALYSLINNIRYLKKVGLIEEKLYKKFRIKSLMNRIKINLNELHILHYFQSYFNIEPTIENINELITELEIVLPSNSKEVVLQQ